jgi:hypothetical protein
MKRHVAFLLAVPVLCSLLSCGSGGGGGHNSESGSTFNAYDEDDLVANTAFEYDIAIDFAGTTVKLSSRTAQAITSDGVTVLDTGSGTVIVALTANGITVTSTVESAVKYELSGTLSGTLTMNSASVYQLYLNGVTVNGSSGPALDLESSARAFIVLASGTTNTLTDQTTHSAITVEGALFGNGAMIFSGTGALSITGNYKHGILCNDYIRVCEGSLGVTVTARDAIRSLNGFIFDGGSLVVSGTGSKAGKESKGIKVEGDESESGAGKGYIVINDGTITVTTISKAITASFDSSEDGDTDSTTYDPDPFVIVNGGTITITTTGTPREDTATVDGLKPEGIESKTDLTINDGTLVISTTDDAINAGSSITINGGYIYACGSQNDAIDSNGTLTINGGVLVAVGTSAPEGAFDCDTNTFKITGGTFVGIGGTVSEPTKSACTQNVLVLGGGTKDSTMAIVSGGNTVAFTFTIPQSYDTMIVSSPKIISGTSYSVYTGGTASGDETFHGLYLGSLSYSGGTAGTSFTVSSRLTRTGGTIFK